MNKINFVKMVASGNDFIVVYPSSDIFNLRFLAKNICDRKFGIGSDGLLALTKSKTADIKIRIFNPDGSEAEMCGNGARCTALFFNKLLANKKEFSIETKAGIVNARVSQNLVKIQLTNPHRMRVDIPLKIGNRIIRVNFINTGVPHAVIFVEGLKKIDVGNLGRQIRYHSAFSPAGTNVNFLEVLGEDSIAIRTYERGVEAETLACGTGSVASALLAYIKLGVGALKKTSVSTQGNEILKVYFDYKKNNFSNVWLEGKARIICKGDYYV